MKKFKDKYSKNKKKWLLYLLLGGLILELLGFIFKRGKIRDIRENFSEFFQKEEKEVEELITGKESFKRFCRDTASIFKDYFIPHRNNKYKPKILHTHSLVAIVFVLVALKIAVTGYLFFIYPNAARMTELITSQVLAMTNEDRVKSGLSPLTIDPVLSASAYAKGQDMIMNNYFAHHSPDGKKPWDWIDRGEYPYLFVGENLAMNFSSANSAHTALMLSPTHKKNILNSRYQNVGLAVVTGEINGKKTDILVELFASKRSTSLAIAEEPVPPPPAFTPSQPAESEIKVLAEPEQPVIENKELAALEVQPEPEKIKKTTVKGDTQETDVIAPREEQISENIDVIEYPALVMDTGNNGIPKNINISPNLELENSPNTEMRIFTAVNPRNVTLAAKLVNISKYIFMTVLLLMIAALMVNIVIRVSVQHKGVIIETLVVILFIAGLISVKIHFLEHIAEQVAVI